MANTNNVVGFTIQINGTQDQVNKINELNKAIATTKEQIKNLQSGRDVMTGKFVPVDKDAVIRAQQSLKSLQTELSGVTRTVQTANGVFRAQSGSMNELAQALALNRMRYRELSAEERNSVTNGQRLLATINQQDAEIKKLDATIGNHQRKVGDYSGALNKMFSGIGTQLKMMAGAFIAAFSFSALSGFIKDGIQSAIKWEEQQKRLLFSSKENVEMQQRLIVEASRLSKISLFKRSDIVDAQILALNLGRTETQANKMVETAMGMSRALGLDLNTAMMQLSMTMEGSIGRLGRIDGRLKGLTDEQLKAGVGVDLLSQRFGKFATEGVDTTAGAMVMLSKEWSGFKRDIGEGAIGGGAFKDLIEGARELVKWMRANDESIVKVAKELARFLTVVLAWRSGAYLAAGAQVVWNTAKNVFVKTTQASTIALETETVAQNASNAAQKRNLWGAIAAILAVVITYLAEYVMKARELTSAEKAMQRAQEARLDTAIELKKVQSDIVRTTDNEIASARALFTIAEKTIGNRIEHKKAIDNINSIYGKFLGYQLSELSNTTALNAAYNVIAKQLIRNREIKLENAKLDSLFAQKQIEDQLEISLRGDKLVEENRIRAVKNNNDIKRQNAGLKMEIISDEELFARNASWLAINNKVTQQQNRVKNLGKEIDDQALKIAIMGNPLDVKQDTESNKEEAKAKAEAEKKANAQEKSDDKRKESIQKNNAEILKLQQELIEKQIGLQQDSVLKQIELENNRYETQIENEKSALAERLKEENLSKEQIQAYKDIYDARAIQNERENQKNLSEIIKKSTDDQLKEYQISLSKKGMLTEQDLLLQTQVQDEITARTKKAINEISKEQEKTYAKAKENAELQRTLAEATITDKEKLAERIRQIDLDVAKAEYDGIMKSYMARKELGILTEADSEKTLEQLKKLLLQIDLLTTGQSKKKQSGMDKAGSFLAKLLSITPEDGKHIIDEAISLAKKIEESIFRVKEQAINARLEADLKYYEDRAQAEQSAVDTQHNMGLMSDVAYAARKKVIDDNLRADKNRADKKAFEDAKELKQAELWINAAVAAIVALATAGNIYVGIAEAAAVLIMAGIESNNIAKQNWTPKYSLGGMINGPSHSGGGVDINAEGGEGVINKRSMASRDRMSVSGTPAQIASAINSYNGYGIPFMRSGGTVPVAPTRISGMSTPGLSGSELMVFAAMIVKGINDKQVVLSEKQLSDFNKRATKIKTESTW